MLVTPHKKPVYRCTYCGEGIFIGDEYVEVETEYGKEFYHRDCLEFDMPFENVLDLFGCIVRTADME